MIKMITNMPTLNMKKLYNNVAGTARTNLKLIALNLLYAYPHYTRLMVYSRNNGKFITYHSRTDELSITFCISKIYYIRIVN